MSSNSKQALAIGNAAAEKKATNIKIMNVKGLSPIADYFVLCSGNSSIQVKAIADEIEEKMFQEGIEIYHKEGYQNARWILLDYGDVIAHVFHTEDREFYDLERFWSDAVITSI